MFVPLAKLFAYFHRTPFEKSYSAFISVSSAFALPFLICSPFSPGCRAHTNDSNRRSPLSMRNDHQPMRKCFSHQDVSLFRLRVLKVRDGDRQGAITERRARFFKGHAVLRTVEAGFGLIPVKVRGQTTYPRSTSTRPGARDTSPSWPINYDTIDFPMLPPIQRAYSE
jgi:hypothetical protein